MLFFFFFKQKTAYEMRISDWSSDVCSSDLVWVALILNCFFGNWISGKPLRSTEQTIWVALEPGPQLLGGAPVKPLITCTSEKEPFSYFPSERLPLAEISIPRSEERRVGKACVITCRSRWSPYN